MQLQKNYITKSFDAIVINSPKQGEGFGFNTNKVSILRKDGTINHYPLKSKQKVANDIMNELEELMNINSFKYNI